MQKSIFHFVVLFSIISAFTACQRGEDTVPQDITPQGRYQKGVFIINEGAFGKGNGEISYFDRDSNKVINNVFGKENNTRPLGDVVQSMAVFNNNTYIVANNSNKVLVVNPVNFKQITEISLKQPRYMVADGTTGYITEWITNDYQNPPKGRVAIIDLTTNATRTQDTITTDGFFPDQLLLSGKRLYVVNSLENTVSILNTETRKFESKIVVGNSPNGIVQDKNSDLWVSVSGEADYSNYPVIATLSPARLLQFSINGSTLVLKNTFTLPAYGIGNLYINSSQDKLYYSFNKKVFEMPVSATALPVQPFISRSFYGIGIDPVQNIFYGGIAPNFTNNGRLVRYNMTTRTALDSVTVGIAPNGFLFR